MIDDSTLIDVDEKQFELVEANQDSDADPQIHMETHGDIKLNDTS